MLRVNCDRSNISPCNKCFLHLVLDCTAVHCIITSIFGQQLDRNAHRTSCLLKIFNIYDTQCENLRTSFELPQYNIWEYSRHQVRERRRICVPIVIRSLYLIWRSGKGT
ncbi:hypothetical protein RvY_03724 [Ramazzottius varieornatus]|uniref:Uncharacterized protein n=1 Tax=Ramazzottius varieornatus TaxID=947166 RepID=A0A1D1UP42_RAMVA|nr:hypothetical protein RvY_03724 [Ramazzottius varieornatus]